MARLPAPLAGIVESINEEEGSVLVRLDDGETTRLPLPPFILVEDGMRVSIQEIPGTTPIIGWGTD